MKSKIGSMLFSTLKKASIFHVTHLFDKINEDKLNNNMFYVSRSSTDYQIQDSGHFQSSLFIAFQTQISS